MALLGGGDSLQVPTQEVVTEAQSRCMAETGAVLSLWSLYTHSLIDGAWQPRTAAQIAQDVRALQALGLKPLPIFNGPYPYSGAGIDYAAVYGAVNAAGSEVCVLDVEASCPVTPAQIADIARMLEEASIVPVVYSTAARLAAMPSGALLQWAASWFPSFDRADWPGPTRTGRVIGWQWWSGPDYDLSVWRGIP